MKRKLNIYIYVRFDVYIYIYKYFHGRDFETVKNKNKSLKETTLPSIKSFESCGTPHPCKTVE